MKYDVLCNDDIIYDTFITHCMIYDNVITKDTGSSALIHNLNKTTTYKTISFAQDAQNNMT